MKNKFIEVLEKGLIELKINLNDKQKESYLAYFQLLDEWNQKINLTAIKEPEEVAIKHFLDSLAAANYFSFEEGQKLLDLGSGAGLPGLILKILKPELNMILVDTVHKKVSFLNLAIKELELAQIEALHRRAEDLGRDPLYREKHQVVTARAVAPMAVLCEYCIPLLALGGRFYALKGPNYQEELEEAQFAIKRLGGKVEKVLKYNLPLVDDQRTLIVIEKEKNTPKEYPRKSGLPAKKPLTDKKA